MGRVSPLCHSQDLLGPAGWTQLVQHLSMSQADARPYFNGYLNGKSAALGLIRSLQLDGADQATITAQIESSMAA